MAEGLDVLDSASIEVGGIASAPETAEPISIQPQSWKGYFVDPTTQDIHVLLHDAYYGVGGFKGDIPVNEANASAPNRTGTYTYVQYVTTELQYRLRAKITPYYNYYGRFIDATVFPVFSHGRINTLTKKNDEVVEDKELDMFVSNASGNGVDYTALQKYAMVELRCHDVAYYSMTKVEGDAIPSLSVYRAIDVIYIEKDNHGRATSYMFYKGDSKAVEDGKTKHYAHAVQFYMQGEFCYIQMYKGEFDGTVGKWRERDIEWGKDGAPRNTGVKEWCVYAHLPVATPNNEMIPSIPMSKRIADVCLAIFQHESRFNWLYAVHNSPTPYIYGSMKGMLAGMGQMAVLKSTDPTKGYAPAPDFMQLDSGMLPASHEVIKYDVERLREIAKENGVDTKTGSQAQSGDSKRFDFQATEQKLRGTVDMCEDMDKWVFHMFDVYMKRNTMSKVYTYVRTYPESFYPDEDPKLEEYEAFVSVAREIGANNSALTAFEEWGKKLLKEGIDEKRAKMLSGEIESLMQSSEEITVVDDVEE